MAALGPCQATIVALSNVTAGVFKRFDNAGTLYALLDAQNRAVGQTPDPTSGRNDGFVVKDTDGQPVVKIRSYQRKVGGTRTVASCDADPVTPDEQLFKVTMYRETAVQISVDSMRVLCGDAAVVKASGTNGTRWTTPNTLLMQDTYERVMSVMSDLVSAINNDCETKLGLQAGVNRRTGLSTAKSYELLAPNGRELNAFGYADMITDHQTMGLGGRPIIIGGAKMNTLAELGKWGNLSASGTDYSKLATNGPFRFYYDLAADTTFGADNFLMFAPGAAKLVTWNKWGGMFNRRIANSEYGQFTVQEFGDDLRWDLQVKEEDCPQPYYNVIISLSFDVYVPKAVYKTGDPNYGVNGVYKGKVAAAAA